MCRSNNINSLVIGPEVAAERQGEVTKTVRPPTIVKITQIHTTPGTKTNTEDKDAVVITSVEAASEVANGGQKKVNRNKVSSSKVRQMTKTE